jgi:hypothetical protein
MASAVAELVFGRLGVGLVPADGSRAEGFRLVQLDNPAALRGTTRSWQLAAARPGGAVARRFELMAEPSG